MQDNMQNTNIPKTGRILTRRRVLIGFAGASAAGLLTVRLSLGGKPNLLASVPPPAKLPSPDAQPFTPPPVAPLVPAAKPIPAWFLASVNRKASWLPANIRTQGLDAAIQMRWNLFSDQTKHQLVQLQVPAWWIALVPEASWNPKDPGQSISGQIQNITNLSGRPPDSELNRRAELLLLAAGALQMPTPEGLGKQGCTAFLRYILPQLKLEFPNDLGWMSDTLATTLDSQDLINQFQRASREGFARERVIPFDRLTVGDIQPGCLMVAGKPLSDPHGLNNHVMGWGRVPMSWSWHPGAMIAVGNTGLSQFGPPHAAVCQEYMSPDPLENGHNQHGQINSHNVWPPGRDFSTADPRTNVYFVRNANFIIMDLLPAAAQRVARKPGPLSSRL